ncbi:MAG: non-ribosomal peptide synthetase, partial [Micromonosporaceae bacterium]
MDTTGLSDVKRALLESRLRRLGSDQHIAAVPRDGPLPLSLQQEGLWFLHRADPGQTVYNIPSAWQVRGPLDVGALRAALTGVVQRHEALRTRFADDGGRPYQIIDPPPEHFPLSMVDTDDPSPLIAAEAQRPFDLATGPVFRGTVLRMAPDNHILLLTVHHIVADGASIAVLMNELAARYSAALLGTPYAMPALAVQPADVAAHQRRQLTGAALDARLDYWRDRLAGLPTLNVPSQRPRPPARTPAGHTVELPSPPALGRQIKEYAQAARASVFEVTLAGFFTVLSRYTGQADLVIGSVFAGRTLSEVEPLIGYFADPAVLRVSLAGDPTFRETVERSSRCARDALGHHVPFARVVEALRPERVPGRNPLFQVSLSVVPAGQDAVGTLEFEGADVVALPPAGDQSRFDLSVGVLEQPDGELLFQAEFATELFDQWFVGQLMVHFGRILAQAMADPDIRLSEFRLLTDDEIAERSPTLIAGPSDRLLGDLGGAPEAPAINTVTYRALDDRANRWAHLLHHTHGIRAERIVAILLERGPDLVTAQLAVTRAGGAWLCLDPAHPPARLAQQLADASPDLVLTSYDLAHLAPDALIMDGLNPPPAGRPAIDTQPDNLAYLIYTSGSTGTPKGVLVTHRNVVDFIDSARSLYQLSSADRVLQFANPTFDVSVADIHTTLTAGATLITAPSDQLYNPETLTGLLREQKITVAHLPPAILSQLDPHTPLPDLRLLIVGGEAYPVALAEQWTRPGREFHNSYGPTETTIDCTDHRHIPGAAALPLGTPMSNHHAYLLDDNLNHVPDGVPGHLHITGTGITRGYHRRPAQTAAAYLPDPHRPGQRMYATGDLARRTPTGQLEFLGRTDRQLKINGVRIEPAEIEHALQQHPHITQAVITTNPLHAYAATTHPDLTPAEINDHLLNHLPTYLIPPT